MIENVSVCLCPSCKHDEDWCYRFRVGQDYNPRCFNNELLWAASLKLEQLRNGNVDK